MLAIGTIKNSVAVVENKEMDSMLRWLEVTFELKSGGCMGAARRQAEGMAGARGLWWEALLAIQGRGEGQRGFVG